ncbi:MAG: PD40 domain-containing protein [Saprospiraceae bacterium]|nr:PD40 domain-containing protein [Saprospiraceae bacterium]
MKVILIFLFCLPISIFAQKNPNLPKLSQKFEKLFIAASAESKNGEYEKAIKKLDKIILEYPDYIPAYTKKAGILYTQKNVDASIETLSSVINNFPHADPEIYFSRGYMYFEKKLYRKASDDFLSFLALPDIKTDRLQKASQYQKSAFFRDSLISNPVIFNPVLLPETVNSSFSEYSPSLSIDGTSLVFTRRINNQEDLYISYFDSSGNYSMAFPLRDVNTGSNEGAHCISADGSLILFTGCDRDILFRGCDIYYSVFRDSSWTKPANIGKVINTPAWESQPSLSADGKTLFFVSDRVGGIGGRDIWYTKKNERDVWSEPVNLGPDINTERDDETPYLHPDGKTLYFRSNGRLGMGDFDIYTAQWYEDKQVWHQIRNIGYPINTEGNEGGLLVSLDGRSAFFATDIFSQKQNISLNLDICRFELPAFARANPASYVKLMVYDAESNKPLTASVEIRNLNNNKVYYSGKTQNSGLSVTALQNNKKYAVFVKKDGFTFFSTHIDLDNVYTFDKPFLIEVPLQKLISPVVAKPTILQNIFFASGSYTLLPESEAEINMLFDLLQNNLSVKIQIVGHTDNLGKPEDNQVLSLQRANAVKNVLVNRNIDTNRILTEGKGQENPIDTNETAEGRKNNRRTEFVIIQ